MKKNLTDRQKINNELAVRANNKKSFKVLKRYMPHKEQADTKIAFRCECSDPDCEERVNLTLQEYAQLHKEYAHFVIAKGHAEPTIEKVKKITRNVSVVDKYAL